MSGPFIASLRAELPEGWFAKESITFLAPDGQGNVIASTEPLDPSITGTRYAEVQGELLRREFPHYQELWFGPMLMLGGHSGYRRDFSWAPPDGVRVRQVQMYAVIDGRGITCTATAPENQFDRMAEVFSGIQASLECDHHRRA